MRAVLGFCCTHLFLPENLSLIFFVKEKVNWGSLGRWQLIIKHFSQWVQVVVLLNKTNPYTQILMGSSAIKDYDFVFKVLLVCLTSCLLNVCLIVNFRILKLVLFEVNWTDRECIEMFSYQYIYKNLVYIIFFHKWF